MRRCCRRLGPGLAHWLGGCTGGHLCAPVWGRCADGTQAARTRHWARVCRQRDLGPGVVLGQAYAGLNKLFTARPLVRLAPAAVSSPHTLTPSPTLLTSPPDLWACGLWAQFRARPLQPSPSGPSKPSRPSRHPDVQTSRYPRIPRSASANRSLLTAVSAPTALKIREPSAPLQVPARDRPMSLPFPRFSPRRRRAAMSATHLICPSHARLAGPSTLHTRSLRHQYSHLLYTLCLPLRSLSMSSCYN
jgi:hypothetical protein